MAQLSTISVSGPVKDCKKEGAAGKAIAPCRLHRSAFFHSLTAVFGRAPGGDKRRAAVAGGPGGQWRSGRSCVADVGSRTCTRHLITSMPQEALEDELLALAALESDDDAAPADAAGAAAASAVPPSEEAAAPSTAEGGTEVGSPLFSESLVTALDRAKAAAGNRMLAPFEVASSSLVSPTFQ